MPFCPEMDAQQWLALARAHAGRDEIGDAIDAYEKSIELEPENAAACRELARLCLLIDEIRAFTNWCHEALRIDPGDGEPHWMMACELAGKGRHQEAVEAVRAALRAPRLDPSLRREAADRLAEWEAAK